MTTSANRTSNSYRMPAAERSRDREFTFLSAKDLQGAPRLSWLVDGVVPGASLACLYGPSGVGKTFLALDLAAAVAEGREWFGHKTVRGRVVYVVLEGRAGLRNRIDAWEQFHTEFPNNVRFVDGRHTFNLPLDAGTLGYEINAAGGADLVVIDSLNRAAPGIDENASHDMGRVILSAVALQAATGGSVLLVHHTGKEVIRGLRGHSSLLAALDSVIEVEREGTFFRWTVVKSRDGKDGISHAFDLVVIELDQTAGVPR